MALSNTAVPKYYGMFRDAVIAGEIPVCQEISMEMNRIDDLIDNPMYYYDEDAIEGWIKYCEGLSLDRQTTRVLPPCNDRIRQSYTMVSIHLLHHS